MKRAAVLDEDYFCREYGTYAKNLVRSVASDCATLADYIPRFKAFAERKGQDWPSFLHDELGGVSPELIAAIEALAALGSRKGKAAL